MLIGVAIDTFFFLKKVRFGRDWLMLQEITTYKNDIADLQSYYLTQSNAYDVMITTAVKVRMAELAKDKQEAAIKRAELVENYRLLMKFKLVETVDNPDEPENFPLRPYFDAAEPKVTETLAFMVTRQKRQSQGLPI